jgi:very-short-patch-repair endonuclease
MDWHDQARSQGGVVGRAQLRALGYSARAIDGMLHRGRMERTRQHGVYRAPGAPDSAESACWLAALGSNSPVTYLTGAQVWDITVPSDKWVHISRFDRRRLDWPPGVRVHRVALDPNAVTERGGLLVTTRTETLLDCLGWLQIGDARALADRAQQQRWLTAADIERRLDNQPGRWGNRRLRWLLPTIGDGAHSEAERRLHKVLRRSGVTGWVPNYPVQIAGERFVIDAALPDHMIAIEVDGYGDHSKREIFQRDRTKQNALIGAGWTVLRFTWGDVVDRPDYVVAAITSLLAI